MRSDGGSRMLKWILILLIVAAVAGLLGLNTISGVAMTGAKILIGIVLGAFDTFIPEQKLCFLQPGDYIVFFTDGITEARNAQGEFLDDEGLEAIISSRAWSSAQELLTGIIMAVDEFSTGAPQADDFTVVVLRRLIAG